MPVEHVDSWSEYGLSGLVIAALFAFIWFLVREHRAERSEWISAYRDQSKQSNEVQTQTNEVIRELTAVIERSNHRNRATDFDDRKTRYAAKEYG